MGTITKRTWQTAKQKEKYKKGGPKEEQTAWRLSWNDEHGKRQKKQFPLRREAEDYERTVVVPALNAAEDRKKEEEKAKREGRAPKPQVITGKTVGDAAREYLDEVLAATGPDVKGNSISHSSAMKGHVNNHIRPYLGDTLLLYLDNATLRKYEADLIAKPNSTGTIDKAFMALDKVLKKAESLHWTDLNPLDAYKRTSKGKATKSKRVTPPSQAELDAIFAAADDFKSKWKDQPQAVGLRIRFAARSGLRGSEQWALHWRDLDLGENPGVWVRSSVDAKRNIKDTKTLAGVRWVPIAKALRDELLAYREKSLFPGENELVFPAEDGGPYLQYNWDKNPWAKIKKAAKVSPKMHWHGLRHYAISRFIAAGMEPLTIKTYAGHSSITVTFDVYGHLFDANKYRDLIEEIGS